MRIALDATPLIEPHGGIPRYVTELAVELARGFPGDEVHLLSDQRKMHVDVRLREAPNVVLEAPQQRFGGKWWSLGLPWELRRRRVDVFHGTNFEVPYLPAVPSVLTLHDLSPWHDPPIRPEGSERVRRRAPWLLKRARFVITPSEAIRREACDRFKLDPRKVEAIPLGVAPPARRNDHGPAGMPGPYALYIGAAGARKNLEMVVEAWRLAREQRPELGFVLAGPGTERFRGLEPGLHALGAVPEERARTLLAGASMFVYPSLYEGFGLPIVEAMQAGIPVIVSGDAALVETAGGAALVADGTNPREWSCAVAELAAKPGLAAEMRQRGLERAAELDWRVTAEKTRAVYARAIRRT